MGFFKPGLQELKRVHTTLHTSIHVFSKNLRYPLMPIQTLIQGSVTLISIVAFFRETWVLYVHVILIQWSVTPFGVQM